MGKVSPFRLTFEFTPRALANRERPREEQFTVTVKDISMMRRLDEMERLTKEAPDSAELPKDNQQSAEEFAAMIQSRKRQAEWKRDFAKRYVVRVNNLTVIGDDDEKELEVKTAAELEEHCSDALLEVADRLLFGAGEEELKNSPSPSSAASSATSVSEAATSTAPATEK